MASNVRVRRWVHIGPRDEIAAKIAAMENRQGAANVEIGNVVTIVAAQPLTPQQVERVLELAQQGKFDALI